MAKQPKRIQAWTGDRENPLPLAEAVKLVKATYRAAFPHDPDGLDLDAWEQFEVMHPMTFGRMYQFWAEKLA